MSNWMYCPVKGHRHPNKTPSFIAPSYAATGTVKWFNAEKSYGYITQDDGGPDVFVHFTVIQGTGYRMLEENQRVEFEITQGPKGPQAEQVRLLSNAQLPVH